MNLTQFQTLSKRTMPFGGEPANQVEFENMLGNYAMGLVGEFAESVEKLRIKDVQGTKKELGDIAHYAVGLLSCIDEKVDAEKVLSAQYSEAKGMVCYTGLILEHAKKVIYHRHEIDKELISENIYKVLKIICDSSFTLSDVLQTNIDKLKTRYPDKFSVEGSIKRVDVDGGAENV